MWPFRPNVEKMEKRGNVLGLIKALQDGEEYVRRKAAHALGWIGDGRAVEPLCEALKDSDAGVRWRAARALGQIGDARAVKPLREALKNSDDDVRRHAAPALEEMGLPGDETV